jgi:predicted DNA repair protein MutK
VPAAVAISFFLPWLVTPLLMLGGAFLCFEGFEKLVHKFLHREEDQKRKGELHEALKNPEVDLRAIEKDKIKGAIRTDFILSAEIIAITLGTVTTQTIGMQFMVLAVVAIMVTVVVYGLVAGIVKLDDGGLYLSQQDNPVLQKLGSGILWLAPYLMKTLSILGTLAMFLVGGGILTHGFTPVYDAIHHFAEGFSGVVGMLVPTIANGLFGVAAGALLVAIITPLTRWWQARSA